MKISDLAAATIGADLFGAIESLDLVELLRTSPSPAHWRLADKLEQAAA